MKIRIIILSMFFIGANSLKATALTNATGNDLRIKVSYTEQCLPDDPLQDLVDSNYVLPNNGRIDISGSPLQNRQKGICYRDIAAIKAIMTSDSDQNITEIATTWSTYNGKDLNSANNIIIRIDSHGKLYLK